MNRKCFLSSVVPLFAGISSFTINKSLLAENESKYPPVYPAYLSPGDTIGITCPAGFITLEEIQPAIHKMQDWGFEIRIGNTVGKKNFTFGGTDEERLADIQQMLDDKIIKAIMCARGGYGAVRIIDKIDFTKFLNKPKWIIGFSDITVIHSYINKHNVVGIHSKMCNSFPDDWNLAEQVQKDSIESIRQCLAGNEINYNIPVNANNRFGECKGKFVGGNLKTLESLAGSNSIILTKEDILFVEDTGEYLYSIDRMFWNLKRSGMLDQLKGLVIGGFKIKKDDEGEEFGKTLEEIVLEKVKEYSYPVCFDFPVGHQKNNFAVRCGGVASLNVSLTKVTFTQT